MFYSFKFIPSFIFHPFIHFSIHSSIFVYVPLFVLSFNPPFSLFFFIPSSTQSLVILHFFAHLSAFSFFPCIFPFIFISILILLHSLKCFLIHHLSRNQEPRLSVQDEGKNIFPSDTEWATCQIHHCCLVAKECMRDKTKQLKLKESLNFLSGITNKRDSACREEKVMKTFCQKKG